MQQKQERPALSAAPTSHSKNPVGPENSTPAAEGEDTRFLYEGERNDNLFRYGSAMRRKDASALDIETKLLDRNMRYCRPPLSVDEVLKIAGSAGKYQPGGPDILEIAWQNIAPTPFASNYEKFVALAKQLQLLRPDFPVALPVVRIAKLFGCHHTSVSIWRRAASSEGVLIQTSRYSVKRGKAATFIVPLALDEGVCLSPSFNGTSTSENHTSTLSSGLVRIASGEEQNMIPDQVFRLADRGGRLFRCREKAKEPQIRRERHGRARPATC